MQKVSNINQKQILLLRYTPFNKSFSAFCFESMTRLSFQFPCTDSLHTLQNLVDNKHTGALSNIPFFHLVCRHLVFSPQIFTVSSSVSLWLLLPHRFFCSSPPLHRSSMHYRRSIPFPKHTWRYSGQFHLWAYCSNRCTSRTVHQMPATQDMRPCLALWYIDNLYPSALVKGVQPWPVLPVATWRGSPKRKQFLWFSYACCPYGSWSRYSDIIRSKPSTAHL